MSVRRRRRPHECPVAGGRRVRHGGRLVSATARHECPMAAARPGGRRRPGGRWRAWRTWLADGGRGWPGWSAIVADRCSSVWPTPSGWTCPGHPGWPCPTWRGQRGQGCAANGHLLPRRFRVLGPGGPAGRVGLPSMASCRRSAGPGLLASVVSDRPVSSVRADGSARTSHRDMLTQWSGSRTLRDWSGWSRIVVDLAPVAPSTELREEAPSAGGACGRRRTAAGPAYHRWIPRSPAGKRRRRSDTEMRATPTASCQLLWHAGTPRPF
jgi:hypothetical protein